MSAPSVTFSLKIIDNCRKKVSYPSETHAERGASGAWSVRKIELFPYLCPVCNRWHLTSKRRRQRGPRK